jgi:hypothetical protein
MKEIFRLVGAGWLIVATFTFRALSLPVTDPSFTGLGLAVQLLPAFVGGATIVVWLLRMEASSPLAVAAHWAGLVAAGVILLGVMVSVAQAGWLAIAFSLLQVAVLILVSAGPLVPR